MTRSAIPTPITIYQTIKASLTSVAAIRIAKKGYGPAEAEAIMGLLDEMARNSTQCVVELFETSAESESVGGLCGYRVPGTTGSRGFCTLPPRHEGPHGGGR